MKRGENENKKLKILYFGAWLSYKCTSIYLSAQTPLLWKVFQAKFVRVFTVLDHHRALLRSVITDFTAAQLSKQFVYNIWNMSCGLYINAHAGKCHCGLYGNLCRIKSVTRATASGQHVPCAVGSHVFVGYCLHLMTPASGQWMKIWVFWIRGNYEVPELWSHNTLKCVLYHDNFNFFETSTCSVMTAFLWGIFPYFIRSHGAFFAHK